MAKLSLQEQLIKAGLVNQAQARTVKTEKYKQTKQAHNTKDALADELKQQIQKKQAEQAAKDLELNRLKKQEEERKQRVAAIKQIIKQNALPLPDPLKTEDDKICAYRFTDNEKVKILYVSPEIQKQLSDGGLGIVKQGERYKVVATEIAKKIAELDNSRLIVLFEEPKTEQNQDDPYAIYKIPDDLMW
jgi:uncharacterized protein